MNLGRIRQNVLALQMACHQIPALQALSRRTLKSAYLNRSLGKRSCPVSPTQRLQNRSHSGQRARGHRSAICQANASSAPVTEKVELDARVAVVLGTQWGDEGKGKLVDILAQKYEIVARAQVGSS